ncbi:hypothetical protein NIES37_45550 [Tolypothrix tenuis PCC 7101]|uniref:Uncharacterized protein n=1 Tax=Tolypothrix tenuis PCC 7101 TaxID=231146 RepID=A0A1Z4N493_9CYAN|nr:hypothetical protein [Aulosira sp. FACHB-113]BAZ00560.1 hypothetical protein NIES37_45550 [Tolypothrix tenuis PCC 7101]BAZ75519.1 hypothetical protein NIES50_41020 [Aulosira laxa NIES-50]
MVKKRLSDLLQEEAQKFTPSEGETAIEVNAEAVSEVEETPTQTPESSTTARRSTPTKADLENTIKELKESLEKSHATETNLQKQVTDLGSAVAEQKALATKLTKELEEAKQAALHLAESNSKLIEEINSLKAEQEKFVEANSQLVAQSNALKQQQETYKPVKQTHGQDYYRKSHRSSERLAIAQPDEPEDSSSQMWLLD